MITIDDRDEFILEQDDFVTADAAEQVVTMPDRKSRIFAGDKATTATRAMFSFKSEMHSLIGNLQETTKD